MSSITYNRNKVDEFKLAFEEYQKAKTTFKEEMKLFKETMNFMDVNNYTNKTSNTIAGSGDLSNPDYVINEKNGILMKVSGRNSTTYDSSINTVITLNGSSAYMSNVEYEGDITLIDDSNKLYQVGLSDLNYKQDNENVVNDDVKYITTNNEPDISGSRDCNLSHLSQCSSRAKMKNKPYYALEGGEDTDGQTICNCYIFDEQPMDIAQERIKTETYTPGGIDGVSYLATLMDGNFYAIKQKLYSDNYSGFYKYDSTDGNLESIISGKLPNNEDYNPFVGDGINSISIDRLGDYTCALSDPFADE